MKKLFTFFCMACITACNNTTENNKAKNDTIAIETNTINTIAIPGKLCFGNILQRDTITMELFTKDTAVYGNLTYNMFEKDDNKGTFKGTIKDNIIKADYIYSSEGKESVREVMFMLKDNKLTEGFGDMVEKNGKFIFKDSSSVKFTQAYKIIDCK